MEQITNAKLDELREFSKLFIKERFMAVVGSIFNGEPRTFTCWYVVVNGKMYWKSRVGSEHSRSFEGKAGMGLRNIDAPNNASLCVYDHAAKYPDDKTGVQIIGKVDRVFDKDEMGKVLEQMAKKFGEEVLKKNKIEDLLDVNTNSTFYSFTPNGFKLVSKDLNVHMEKHEEFKL